MLHDVMRKTDHSGLEFKCPACNTMHSVNHGVGTGPRWGWNGKLDKPTLTPSVLVRSGHFAIADRAVPSKGDGMAEGCWCSYFKANPKEDDGDPDFKCGLCHSFVVDGRIQFLSDCSHSLAGQTVDLPELDTNA